MVEKVVTKRSFIGGRLVYPGETVDVDAKGKVLAAASTPIGNLTLDQLRDALAAREAEDKRSAKEPVFGSNLADPDEAQTGAQPLVMAPIAPGDGKVPQALPPGSVPGPGDSFVRPASPDAEAAIEVVTGHGADPATVPSEFSGAAVAGQDVSKDMTKGELLNVAQAEGVTVEPDDTKANIVAKIEKARQG
jgi:hypothetical protein